MAIVAPDLSTRDRLVAAAAEVFAERGYDATRVQEVARRAGLTTGAIYGNFRGKADLLLAAIETTSLDSLFAAHADGLDAAETLRRAGRHLVTKDARDARALLFEAFVAARRDPEVASLLRTRVLDRNRLLAGLVADLDTDLDDQAVVRFCHALAMGFLVTDALDLPDPNAAAWATVIDRVVTVLKES